MDLLVSLHFQHHLLSTSLSSFLTPSNGTKAMAVSLAKVAGTAPQMQGRSLGFLAQNSNLHAEPHSPGTRCFPEMQGFLRPLLNWGYQEGKARTIHY